ncbi:MAG: hypothetical protein QOD53_1796, partial [Thermoleophilaceae bacterium]|nr:hypothetical protein [Thermoleophilaceae bacterium]
RARALGAAGVALAVHARAWPRAVSAVPRSPRPYPLGSTDGSVWSSIVGFNGVQRLQGPRHGTPSATTAKSAGRAPGPTRLFRPGSWDLRTLVGVELLSALVLGGLCLAARPWGRAPPGEPPRLRLAMGAALALWLLPAAVVFSTVQGLHPRYLEAMAPAVAAVLGVGIAGLARLGGRELAIRAAAAAWVLVACAYLTRAERGAAVLVTWVAAAALCVALAAARPRGRAFVPLAAGLAVVALLAVPLARSAHLIDTNASTAGQLGVAPRAQTAALSRYLGPRTRGARWELATSSYLQAPALVVRDARPVMILAGVNRQVLVSQARVAAAVRRGELRYALVGGACGRARRIETKRHCPPAVRWVRLHGVDVSHAAGLPGRGLLFRLRAAAGGVHPTRSQHGRRLG